VRKNFPLIYELLDEVMDYGVPQSTNTEALKTFVLNEPVVVTPSTSNPRSLLSFNKGPTGVFKSVLDTSRTDGKRRDEIFVDVVERITCTFNSSGYIVSSQVDGAVQIKSYLAGNPPLKIKLNDDLIIGKRDNPYGGRQADTGE
jgi:AP-4 complex subunit mu-1